MSTRTLRLVAVMMIATMLNLSLYQTAAAAVIDTGDAMRTVAHADRLSDVQAVLARADVQAVLVSHGVTVEDAMQRIAALSEEELTALQQEFDQLPAGGIGLFEVLGITFLILLILELTGVTNIFSKF
jgi:hypothetical protein